MGVKMNDYNFVEELFKLVSADKRNAEKQLNDQYKKAIFSLDERKRYEDLLTQYKIIYRVLRNSVGEHKLEDKE